MKVTAILNIFQRVDNLEKQINYLLLQSYKIDKFIINVNNTERKAEYEYIINKLIPGSLVIENSQNLGVWNRFFVAFNCNTEFVFILDDDVIPGRKWIENGIKVLEKEEALIGSWGSIFKSLKVRKDRTIISETNNRPDKLTRVNMSGHSWLFKKETLPKMFSFLPKKLAKYKVCGEELLISWNASKFGINTYILPMSEDKHTRGNMEPNLGNDRNSGYNLYGNNLYQEFYEYCISLGYNPIEDYNK